MRQELSEQLATSIVEFCRFVRTHGFTADMRQTITALDAARGLGAIDKQSLRFALQAALCTNNEEWERFPRLFQHFWSEAEPDPRTVPGENKKRSKKELHDGEESSAIFAGQTGSHPADAGGTQRAIYGASALQRLRKVDFSEVSTDDLPALEAISIRLLHRMMRRLSRRLAISSRAVRIDLRRSIRRSIARGGDPLTLAWKARKRSRNNFVILIDISGSMNFYSMFLVRFAYALQAQFPRVHTFLFSTGVVPISDLLRGRNIRDALRRLSQRAAGWSGGTKIGESLRQFHRVHGKVLTRDTVFMILSDGWETGDPQLLAERMRAVRRQVLKIIWLNPLLGLKDYQPVTRGMAAALPYIDVFAPAHNLESLLALEKQL
jgi:uncharacterized protein with von Willebrand factor type A (vWA) domain